MNINASSIISVSCTETSISIAHCRAHPNYSEQIRQLKEYKFDDYPPNSNTLYRQTILYNRIVNFIKKYDIYTADIVFSVTHQRMHQNIIHVPPSDSIEQAYITPIETHAAIYQPIYYDQETQITSYYCVAAPYLYLFEHQLLAIRLRMHCRAISTLIGSLLTSTRSLTYPPDSIDTLYTDLSAQLCQQQLIELHHRGLYRLAVETYETH